jgi:hypothetical protein
MAVGLKEHAIRPGGLVIGQCDHFPGRFAFYRLYELVYTATFGYHSISFA